MCQWSGNVVKGAYLPVEIFAFWRKYNRLPLDAETRITLVCQEKVLLHLFPATGEGGSGQSPGIKFSSPSGGLFKGREDPPEASVSINNVAF